MAPQRQTPTYIPSYNPPIHTIHGHVSHLSKTKLYIRQPSGFGPAASPRQDLATGKPFTTWSDARMHLARIVTASDHDALDAILPEGFHTEKDKPATIMYEVMLLR